MDEASLAHAEETLHCYQLVTIKTSLPLRLFEAAGISGQNVGPAVSGDDCS
jgi:hypothetical protein